MSPDDREKILRMVADGLLAENREELDLRSPTQVAGILDIAPKTLLMTDCPRVTIVPNKVIRYRLADVKAWLESRRA